MALKVITLANPVPERSPWTTAAGRDGQCAGTALREDAWRGALENLEAQDLRREVDASASSPSLIQSTLSQNCVMSSRPWPWGTWT
eukprot:2431185-Pyramimonas_sp.AAC.1